MIFCFSSTWGGWISTTIWSQTEINGILYKYSSIAVNCAEFRGTNRLFGFRSRSMKIPNVREVTFASLLEVSAGPKEPKSEDFNYVKKMCTRDLNNWKVWDFILATCVTYGQKARPKFFVFQEIYFFKYFQLGFGPYSEEKSSKCGHFALYFRQIYLFWNRLRIKCF